MIDKRIGERIKQSRERLGLTQDQFAERLGLTTNYISTVERGASFPRCEKLIAIVNGLEVSADAIFCDVITHANEYRSGHLSGGVEATSPREATTNLRNCRADGSASEKEVKMIDFVGGVFKCVRRVKTTP